jgi:hypothetical protein
MTDLLVILPRGEVGIARPVEAVAAHEPDAGELVEGGVDVVGPHSRLIPKADDAQMVGVRDEPAFVIGLRQHPEPQPERPVRHLAELSMLERLGLDRANARHSRRPSPPHRHGRASSGSSATSARAPSRSSASSRRRAASSRAWS